MLTPAQCHPLGMFESMATLTVAKTASELYNSVIVDTPLAPFFQDCLSYINLVSQCLSGFPGVFA